MRILGIDLGSRRVGLAVSDPDEHVATPLAVLPAAGMPALSAALRPYIDEYEIASIVVGLPTRTDGREGPEAAAARAAAAELGELLAMPVEMHDERFTTRMAHEAAGRMGVAQAKRRGRIDMMAATVLLQSRLDGCRRRDENHGR